MVNIIAAEPLIEKHENAQALSLVFGEKMIANLCFAVRFVECDSFYSTLFLTKL
jgi:hypothetical protein